MKELHDIIASAIDYLDEEYSVEAADCFPLKKSGTLRQSFVNAEDLVEMKDKSKKSGFIAKIVAVAAAFICVATVSVFLITNNNRVQVLGSESSHYSDSRIDNPLTSDKETIKNEYADTLGKYSKGSCECIINNQSKIIYTGGKVTIPVSITASKNNEYDDMSIGLSAVINGTVQTLSVDGMKETNMLIFKDLAPGETINSTISFIPVVDIDNKDCEKLPIQFFVYHNPLYIASESYPAFGNTHDASYRLATTITFEKEPDTIDSKLNAEITKELITDSLLTKYSDSNGTPLKLSGNARVYMYQDKKTDTGVLKLSEDGSLKLGLMLYVKDFSGKYRISLFKNDELISLDGRSYIDTELNEGYLYTTTLNLTDVKRGDYIHAALYKLDDKATNPYPIHDITAPQLIVNSDFTSTDHREPAPETSSPDSKPSQITDSAIVKGDILSINIIGYIRDGDKRLAVLENYKKIYVSDIDENKRISEIVDYEKLEDNGYFIPSMTADGKKLTINKEIISDNEAVEAIYYHIFDKDLSVIKEIPAPKKGECWYTDGVISDDTRLLKPDYSEGEGGKLYLCDYDGANKEIIYNFEYQHYAYNLSGDSEYVYFRERDQINGTETAVVIDLKDNSVIKYNGNALEENGGVCISNEGNFILFPDTKSMSGKLVIYDKSKKEFREISTKYHSEGSLSTALSPDGAFILTSVSEISEADGKTPTGTYLRVYACDSGELVFEEKINDTKTKSGGTLIVGNEYAVISTTAADYRIKYR